MKYLLFCHRNLIIALTVSLLLAGGGLASAQKKNTRSAQVYGPPAPTQRYPDSYSSRLNGQVEAYEAKKHRSQLEQRQRINYFRRFIDHDFSITNRGGAGY